LLTHKQKKKNPNKKLTRAQLSGKKTDTSERDGKTKTEKENTKTVS